MADPEVKINIKTEYDGAAAERALLDIENLPLEAQGLAEVFNQNFAAVERMEEGLRAATASMREHIASLDPAAEGYEKAVAAAQSYIAQQVTLSQQCEKVRGDIVEQAGVINDLSRSLARGRISERAFNDELEGISQEGIKAEQTIERLAARIDRLNARRHAATNLDPDAAAQKAAEKAAAAAEKAAERQAAAAQREAAQKEAAAQREAAAREAAAARAAAAAQKEQQKDAELRREMDLSTKSRAELRAEIERLTAAMREAAVAGNGEQFERLRARIDEARRAMARLNAEARRGRVGTSFTIPAESMNSWRGFVNYVKRGTASCTLSLKNMTAAAGGLARIGAYGALAKVGFDGLGKTFRDFSERVGMGIDETVTLSNVCEGFFNMASGGFAWITGSIMDMVLGTEKAKVSTDSWAGAIGEVINNIARAANMEAELAAIKAENERKAEEYNRQLEESQQTARRDLREATQQIFTRETDAGIARAQESLEAMERRAEDEYNAASVGLEARREAAEREHALAEQNLELARARGSVSAATAEIAAAELDAEHEKKLAAIEQEAAAMKERYAAAMADASEAFRGELGKVLTEGELGKWAPVLEVQLPDMERLRVITDRLELAKKDFGKTYTAAEYAAQQRLVDERKGILDQVRALAATINGIDASLGVTSENAVSFAQGLQESAGKLQEIREKAEEEGEEREEALEAAREENRQRGRLAELTRRTADSQKAAAAAAAEQKRLNDDIKRALTAIGNVYKTSRRYSVQDNRTEAQKVAADKGILESRLAELRRLRRSAINSGAKPEDLAGINDEIIETREQMRAYNSTLAAGRQDAARALSQWKTAGPPATNHITQGNVRNLRRAMDALARQYERAAAKGDTEAMARISERGRNCAQSLERLSGFTGKYAAQWQEIQAQGTNLANSYRGLSVAEERELATLQRNERQTARREVLERKINEWKKRHVEAEGDATRAMERRAEQEKRNVKLTVAPNHGGGQAGGQSAAGAQQRMAAAQQQMAGQTAQMTAQMTAMQGALSSAAGQMGTITGQMGSVNAATAQIGSAVQQMAATAGQMAAAAGQAAVNATAALAALRSQLANLQSQVSRLSSLS